MSDAHKVNEKEKLKAFLVEIMLNPNKNHDSMNYQWYPKYQIHATYAGYVHTLGYTKYAISKYAPDPKYALSAKGRKWLDKQQKGDSNEQ